MNAGGVSGAAFTTVNEAVDGSNRCKNGSPNINCNQYTGKQYVWLNGGPAAAGLESGTYFWVVLQPGGQPTVQDGTAKNLSDDTDPYTNRIFTWQKGVGITAYSGTHDKDLAANRIRVGVKPALVANGPDWYANTPNNGGVYILAICSLKDGYANVSPRDCKYDAFKVQEGEDTQTEAAAPTVLKNADGVYDKLYTWTIAKDVDKTLIKKTAGTATFNYTVVVTRDNGKISGVKVVGVIDAFNPNAAAVNNVTIGDQLSDGTVCKIGGQNSPLSNVSLASGSNEFGYECDLGLNVPTSAVNNVVTMSWTGQPLSDGKTLTAGNTDWTVASIAFAANEIDESVTVTDTWNGTSTVLGTVPPFDALTPNSATFTYAKTVDVPASSPFCVSYNNKAEFETVDTKTKRDDSETVTVCGPPKTGARTIGFWQNTNGQGVISGQQKSGVCPSATFLRDYLPFQDLPATASCSAVAKYVADVIKIANSSGESMNPMLKAQMLATALDVYFTGVGSYAGSLKFLPASSLGNFTMDLTYVCKTSAALCYDVSSAFDGAKSMSVSAMLTHAASKSNLGGSDWYANNKPTQEKAKDAFDAINNQIAFAP
jgi:hypothetical protein